MRGKIKIQIKNRHITFNFTLERNVTILTGDSGTGKTKLINMVRNYSELGEQSGVILKCSKPCLVLSNANWKTILENTHESIVFVEESTPFLSSYEFAKAIQGSDNYYVLVTREPLAQIPYSIDAIRKIHKNGAKPKFEKIYKNISKKDISAFPYDIVIVEDSRSGLQFFKKATEDHDLECISSNGKSGIVKLLEQHKGKHILVIADAAALGSEIKELMYLRSVSNNKIDLFLPESFEWLILRSAIFDSNDNVQEILADPAEHIDCEKYFSWERFFTALLVAETNGRANLEYHENKSHIPSGYLSEQNIYSILNAMKK